MCAGPADGVPVLLIHGFGASVGHWRNNIPALAAAGYRTYAIDLLGFGGSDKPPQVRPNAA
jgi:pimeloyl-ACP methyl ester carboxylesterase